MKDIDWIKTPDKNNFCQISNGFNKVNTYYINLIFFK